MAVKVYMKAGPKDFYEYKNATHVSTGEHNYVVLRKMSGKPDELVAVFPAAVVDHIDILED